MYERLLLPVGEKASPDDRYEPVFDLAREHGATIVVLSVADTNRDSVTNLGGEVIDTLETEATDAAERFADRAREHSVRVETEVVQGTPHEEVVAYADAREIDLIVMRKRERGRLQEALLGSVTDRVIRLTDTPVLVL
ncbi:universal stress protein [Halalkalicoccus jeotgali]|uniref:Universal stress protein 1 n=1 Tax=Halalkalicoccus jeotgali (strain DSM 18796 / CECT 7217 / JCM 14584 / KCTC 4019 / B3) TaxID=795797 RepID=D8J8M3_HALJB|nr:universal stress protein [Halalkalicoccus jeotgali]ADJ14208.1 universal stress protein 1 [Halalkalicoccus jeotgali B3]ELY34610.1 universal stress protein 1 [Halalkalicoccus jeotgali B3]